MTLLEDPDQRPEGGPDRQDVHDHRLEREHDRSCEQEEHQVGDDHHVANREWDPLQDEVGEVDREGSDQHRAPRGRGHATQGAHDGARGIALLAVLGDDRENGDLRARRPMDDRLDPRRLRRGGLGEQRLVGGATQGRIEAHQALHVLHARDLLDALR